MLNDKKNFWIPPIIHYKKFVRDFKKKPSSLIIFWQNSALLSKNSVLPSSTNPTTDQYLAYVEFTKDDIKRIIYELFPNKAHGHHMISIQMLKKFVDVITEPLFEIFKNCL